MPTWKKNFRQLEKRGILGESDRIKIIEKYGKFAAHLAIAQEDPSFTTREKIFERARRLRKSIDPFFNPKT